MSETETREPGAEHPEHGGGDDGHAAQDHSHPPDSFYIRIAIILGVITAAEVGTFYIDMSVGLLIALLVPMMVAKFAVVAAYFMHLKFDKPILSQVFVGGLVLAVIVYMIALTAFEFWSTAF